ncbi:Zn-finger protein [Acanthamoeba polyphaga moumouvirus]|uniref:Zn-finger protein n=1 Tax=Acanthamoeba polyphaga moumouvirus TaxID=1269028 RepID=L7RAX7_9VIRU|nr:Zn-finger protein [Acanthamoeba polyphaga moumouvirus]AGC01554.1 Zn-finger protein [Acanthamoeba polyphaga moumouvirus]
MCRWCKNWVQAVPGKGTTKCSSCSHNLHGAIANDSHTIMHFQQSPYVSSGFCTSQYMPSYTPSYLPLQF